MTPKTLLLALALLTPACKHLSPLTDRHVISGTPVFVFAGQSNMVGAGLGGELPPDKRVLAYGMNDQLAIAKDPIYLFRGPFKEQDLYDPSEFYGIGPDRFFAATLLSKSPSSNLVLVPSGRGATSITQWQPGTPLFEALRRRTRESVRVSGGYLAALLFWQGESDYIDMDHATHWAERFTTIVETYRAEFGNVPVIYVQIAPRFDQGPYTPIREALRANQASVNLPGCIMVQATGLEPYTNVEHFTTEGYAVMGQRMAEAYYGNVILQ
jgi:hypothetical protein